MYDAVVNELFFFGPCLEKFAPHKAGRVVGMYLWKDQDAREFHCFRIQYPDGEFGHAEFLDGECHEFELLTKDEAIERHGEAAFK